MYHLARASIYAFEGGQPLQETSQCDDLSDEKSFFYILYSWEKQNEFVLLLNKGGVVLCTRTLLSTA